MQKCKNVQKKMLLFIEGKLEANDKQRVKDHLRICMRCFSDYTYAKSVYKTDDELLKTPDAFLIEEKKLFKEQIEKEKSKSVIYWFENIKKRFISILLTLQEKKKYSYTFVPATVAIVVIIVFLLISGTNSIENIRMSQKMYFSQDKALGFALTGEWVDYTDMRVELNEDRTTLVFTWKSVPGSQGYQIDLIFDNSRKRITPDQGIITTVYHYQTASIPREKKIIWQLSGKSDRGFFSARSAFIIQ